MYYLLPFAFLVSLIFFPMIKPIVLASIFAFALHPYVKRVKVRVPAGRLASQMVFLGVMLVLFIPVVFLTLHIYSSLKGMVESSSVEQTLNQINNSKEYLLDKVYVILESYHVPMTKTIRTFLDYNMTQLHTYIGSVSTQISREIPGTLFSAFIFFMMFYALLGNIGEIRGFVLNLNIFQNKKAKIIFEALIEASRTAVIINLIVGATQALILSAGVLAFGPGGFVFVFVLTFLASFVPVVGTLPVTGILTLMQLAAGETHLALAIFCVGIVAATSDNILRSYLVSRSDEVSIHPAIALVGVLGAIQAFGIIGIFLGPLLMNTVGQLWRRFHFGEPETESSL